MIPITICNQKYLVKKEENLLKTLHYIKTTQNNCLSYRSGCRSGVCGSCAVRVNGIEKLACKTTIKRGDSIEPLKNTPVIRDLVVDLSNQSQSLKSTCANLKEKSNATITTTDERNIDLQSNCILCNSCYSSCPIFDVNKDFIGPFALTRTYRYVNDKKENNSQSKIDAVQKNGIWDCTLCGNCNMVCPEHIDIKNDIMMLRNKSVQLGYNNPNMESFNSSFDTSLDFGFNPNSF